MQINKIHIHNFKSVADYTLNFSELHGFWEISGNVGTGKTTLGEAILYGLFGSVKSGTNREVIKWGESRGEIELWCTSNSKQLYIKRSLNKFGQSDLCAEVDGVPIVYTNKRDIQKQLQADYYDVTRQVFETLCIISFNGFKSLSSLSARDVQEFVDQVFGLNILTDYVARCKQCRYVDSSNLTQIATKITGLETTIEQFKLLSNIDVKHIKRDIQELHEQIVAKMTNLKSCQESYDTNLTDLNNLYIKESDKLNQIKLHGSQLKKQIEFIKKGVCPTCGALIDTSNLDMYQEQRNSLLKEYQKQKAVVDNLSNQITTLKQQSAQDISKQRLDIESDNKQLSTLTYDLDKSNQITDSISDIEKQLTQQRTDYSNVQRSVEEWNELINLLGNQIRESIIDNLIPVLNYNIQYYLTQLQQPYVVDFDNNFKCHISIPGNNSISVSNLSTGQLKTLDMIIILSILKLLISSNSNNIIFLDELLSNSDAELRDRICELLKNNLQDHQSMFIISHAPLSSSYLDGRIEVQLKNGQSEYTIVKD